MASGSCPIRNGSSLDQWPLLLSASWYFSAADLLLDSLIHNPSSSLPSKFHGRAWRGLVALTLNILVKHGLVHSTVDEPKHLQKPDSYINEESGSAVKQNKNKQKHHLFAS